MPTGGVKREIRRSPKASSEYEDEEERPRRRSREEDDDREERRPSRSRREEPEDDDYEERPSRRSRSRDDEEEEEDDRPRSRRRPRDDDEEEERPRSRRSRERDDDEEDDRPAARRSREDDKEDDRPRSRRSRRDEDDDDDDAAGWSGAKKIIKDMPSDFAGDFTPPGEDDNPTIIKFIQPEPFYTYRQHWCDWLPQGSKLGHLCPKVDCPLCDSGVKVQAKSCFNIIDFSDRKNPVNKVWRVGIKLQRVLENHSKQPKSSPLDRPDLYFEVYRTGGGGRRSGGRVQTNVNPIKARDLYEDYRIEPLEDDEIESYEKKMFTKKDVVQPTPRSELNNIARAIKD